MPTLLHISDLHFGPHYLPPVGEALLAAAEQIESDAIVASGDFTNRATPEEFEQAAEFLGRLPERPLVVTPGNHDVPLYRVWERLTQPHREYLAHITDELNSVTRVPGATIASIDSTAPRRAIVNGRIDRWQLDFCEEAFAPCDDGELRVVVAHHHFAPAPDYKRSETLPGAKRALDRFSTLGVELILGGHLHRAYVGNSLDVYAGQQRDRGIVIAQSGTTTSRRGRAREREKNSFNVVETDARTIVVTHWMYLEGDREFAPVARHTFPRRSVASLAEVDTPAEA